MQQRSFNPDTDIRSQIIANPYHSSITTKTFIRLNTNLNNDIFIVAVVTDVHANPMFLRI